jgi:beta-glucosidase
VAVGLPAAPAGAQAVAAIGTARSGAAAYAQPWLNRHQTPGQRADELLAKMTLAQKLQMVDGTGFGGGDYAGHIAGIPSLGVPDLYLADGAVGVGNGSTGVTWFPSGTSDAATWDPALVRAVGAADGTEQAAKGHNVSLARPTSTSCAPPTAAARSRDTGRIPTSARRSPRLTCRACRAPG